MTLFQTIQAAGIPFGNHASDLYFQKTPESMAILAQFPEHKVNSSLFLHQTTRETWIDVPFAFDPFWESKLKRH